MSTGGNIKKFRALRNFTQSYMAEKLNLSLSGYSKIERDGTNISLKRLQQIAEILETDINTILSFDERNVFNFSHNHSANGVVQNQQIIAEQGLEEFFKSLKDEITFLKSEISNLKSKT